MMLDRGCSTNTHVHLAMANANRRQNLPSILSLGLVKGGNLVVLFSTSPFILHGPMENFFF